MKTFFFKTTSVLLIAFCSITYTYGQNKAHKTKDLVALMTGSYNSEKQSKADSTYYNISLHMYPIWKKDKNTSWLYVEQALYSKQDAPYRQRVYKVAHISENKFKTTIFKLKDEKSFIGKWKTTDFFDTFDTSILEERSGCEVYLTKNKDGVYQGSTLDDNCKSTLRGASYATSKVTIKKDLVYSWDQGFDKDHKQVWGAEKAGYTFDKL
ncbi:chromophore lyase CpcT/CpeT [Aquimarina gracilis]|uniref:Chromophore lyase CpcT/CpeT n=1 Tax=Aquimarina gracilis TaxID=874422 RepID=A0ABU6A2I5_9FLAO|nr:chromophore lyase CpcT/CpeT [Aquimarina gracilis]MEB3348319.1 chromophore lyase CpcT/CpeT [Aquimarina gracilis]